MTSRAPGRALQRRIEAAEVDVVVAVAASHEVAYLDVDVPLVQVSDASLALISDYYGLFTDLHVASRFQARVIASRTGHGRDRFVMASEWAKHSLVHDYGVPPHRVSVAPFGPSVVPTATSPRRVASGELRVLLVASDWERKGGDRAIAILTELKSRGIPVTLTVVGNAPALPVDVHCLGRVERAEMSSLYLSHDVLLEPARANAGGVTLTDAAAHGLPVVATRTGGVPSIVEDGVSGFLVEQDEVVPASVEAVIRLKDRSTWARVSAEAAHAAASRLSWAAWCRVVLGACREALG